MNGSYFYKWLSRAESFLGLMRNVSQVPQCQALFAGHILQVARTGHCVSNISTNWTCPWHILEDALAWFKARGHCLLSW